MSRKAYRTLNRILAQLAILAGAIVISVPSLYMLSASFMSSQDFFSTEFHLLPTAFYWQNYIDVFASFNFGNYLKNSLLVTAAVVGFNLLFTPMVGYSLAKFDFPGKTLLLLFVLATIMIPFTAILIPLFLIVRSFGWVNTYPGLIMPFAMSAFGVFLMRQFILAVPDDYIDAGRIDGASELRIYFQIVVPLIQPALITLAIVVFVASWDEFLWMLIITTGDALRTLPVGLAKFVEQYRTRYELMMAGSVVAAAPVVLVFLAVQRRFLQGMAGLSGLK
ncbi:MAG: carbohydrate ABC transporter permease [Caldilinea sp.]|uniref:carbohydrate ABC transporter permease n=1 Tax=Caldilinea sp. TaxID=2293560 RepID=UPI002C2FD392|nr:carbohydrate ABC transporter permease [Anaerolineales bacterium]HQY90340.1 carbohydrate ABC transporter permease [Caldilinea sp.]HRA67020.1 carbohydrate ABC transporter permease [Caldilinea sp.]